MRLASVWSWPVARARHARDFQERAALRACGRPPLSHGAPGAARSGPSLVRPAGSVGRTPGERPTQAAPGIAPVGEGKPFEAGVRRPRRRSDRGAPSAGRAREPGPRHHLRGAPPRQPPASPSRTHDERPRRTPHWSEARGDRPSARPRRRAPEAPRRLARARPARACGSGGRPAVLPGAQRHALSRVRGVAGPSCPARSRGRVHPRVGGGAVASTLATMAKVEGAASLDLRDPGQGFGLESGLAYNWHRRYDATTGHYTQVDPLGTSGVAGPGSLRATSGWSVRSAGCRGAGERGSGRASGPTCGWAWHAGAGDGAGRGQPLRVCGAEPVHVDGS